MMPSGHKAFLVSNTKDVELLLMHNRTFAAEYVFSSPFPACPNCPFHHGSREADGDFVRMYWQLTYFKQDRPQRLLPQAHRHHRSRKAAWRQGHEPQGQGHDRGIKHHCVRACARVCVRKDEINGGRKPSYKALWGEKGKWPLQEIGLSSWDSELFPFVSLYFFPTCVLHRNSGLGICFHEKENKRNKTPSADLCEKALLLPVEGSCHCDGTEIQGSVW